jgi:stress response protein YsnF
MTGNGGAWMGRPYRRKRCPVERVRLGKETVTEQETVDDEVRKERVDLDGDVPQSDRR